MQAKLGDFGYFEEDAYWLRRINKNIWTDDFQNKLQEFDTYDKKLRESEKRGRQERASVYLDARNEKYETEMLLRYINSEIDKNEKMHVSAKDQKKLIEERAIYLSNRLKIHHKIPELYNDMLRANQNLKNEIAELAFKKNLNQSSLDERLSLIDKSKRDAINQVNMMKDKEAKKKRNMMIGGAVAGLAAILLATR